MTRYAFLDDYSEGCHPEILEALAEGNLDQHVAYGADQPTARARELIATACGRDVAVHLVAGGTLANLIVCAAVLRPHEAVVAAASGHVVHREAGAIEATGHKVLTVDSNDGRLTPDAIRSVVQANGQAPHMAKPRLVYISDATELGTVYSLAEMTALRSVCDELDLLLMVDGARLGVALASERSAGLGLGELASLADVFWIGGTKAGTLFGEAIVVPDASLAADFAFHLKQRGALLAKGRTLGVQFATLFSDDLFGRAAVHANRCAQTLGTGLKDAGHSLQAEVESNQVFVSLPDALIAELQATFAFYVWNDNGDGSSVVRLVTSWATDPGQVERFVLACQGS